MKPFSMNPRALVRGPMAAFSEKRDPGAMTEPSM
jgi:hypothetical protein